MTISGNEAAAINFNKKAYQWIHEPYTSSEEEKIKAIECLEQLTSSEAVESLVIAFEMVKLPLPSELHKFELKRPLGGSISGRAAQALANINNPKGVQTLNFVLANPDAHHPFLRGSLYWLRPL